MNRLKPGACHIIGVYMLKRTNFSCILAQIFADFFFYLTGNSVTLIKGHSCPLQYYIPKYLNYISQDVQVLQALSKPADKSATERDQVSLQWWKILVHQLTVIWTAILLSYCSVNAYQGSFFPSAVRLASPLDNFKVHASAGISKLWQWTKCFSSFIFNFYAVQNSAVPIEAFENQSMLARD